jgi:2-polyprenyl-6-methoxyphenol hydroxylase-like FAD-dependent oxidoreductase
MPHSPRIAIVGAGPGGLTLARILHLHGIEATVFEQEEHSAVRPQGGTLDLHAETGQFALRTAGLESEFKRVARYEDQGFKLYNKQGALQYEESETGGDRPEVDRAHLRQILLDALPSSTIRWGHSLRAVIPNEDGACELQFQSGACQSFDLVVGADGAWSRVRPLLSQVKPLYTGVAFVELDIEDADRKALEIASLVGHGKIFALGDSKGLIAQRNAGAHIYIYAGLRTPEDWATTGGLDLSSAQAAKASLATQFEGWSDSLLQLIHQSSERVVPRTLYALPTGHRWQNRPGITLLGDAAHLMSPFSGEGANLAMRDAADLALALANTSDWHPAIAHYEDTMLTRAAVAAAGAWNGLQEAFSEQGLSHVLQQMQSHHV